MTADGADQDRLGRKLGAGKHDRLAQLRAGADAGAVTEHDRSDQASPGPDRHIPPDPRRSLDLGVGGQLRVAGDDHAGLALAAVDLQAQLAAQRVEGPLAQLCERADVIPVLADLVDVKGDVFGEQRREYVLGPVHERALGKVVEDLGREHVDAAVAEVRERFVGARLLLKAGDAPVAVVQDDAELARVGDFLDGQRRDTARFAVPGGERLQVDVGERVARDHQKRLAAEELGAGAHAPGRAEQLGLVAIGQPLAEVLADRVGEPVQVGDRLVEPIAVEQVDDVCHHRPVEHRDHRLGDLVRERPQARAEAGGENHCSHRAASYRIAARSVSGSRWPQQMARPPAWPTYASDRGAAPRRPAPPG